MTAATPASKPWFQKKPSLTVLIFASLLLGLAIGAFFPTIGVAMEPLSVIFIRMIKMMVAPLLFATLVVGIAGSGDKHQVGRMGIKTLVYFEIATTVALVMGLVVANVWQPGKQQGLAQLLQSSTAGEVAKITGNAATLQHHSFLDSFVHMVPDSVVAAMANGDILQVVVFAVFFALALMAAGDAGKPVLRGLESLSEVMFKFVGYVMAFAPLGVMGAIAATVGKNGLGILSVYANLVGALYFALALFVLTTLVTVCAIIKVPFLKLIKAIKEPFLLAFSTASSESALPKAMSVMERFGVPRHIVSFVMPTGYSFNLDGSTLYLALASLFVAQLYNIELSIGQQLLMMFTLMLTSKGVAAVPRASLVILAGTLTAFGLPVEGIGVILGIDHVLDMGRTSVNLVGNCVASAVVARWEGQFDDNRMNHFDTDNELALERNLPTPSEAAVPATPQTNPFNTFKPHAVV